MTITAQPSLFDLGVGFDSPRTRRDDPVASHMAADQSANKITEVRKNIYYLLELHGPMTGTQLNDLYAFTATRRDWWTRVSYDSPRKRAAEMVADGLLMVTNEDAKRGIGRIYEVNA